MEYLSALEITGGRVRKDPSVLNDPIATLNAYAAIEGASLSDRYKDRLPKSAAELAQRSQPYKAFFWDEMGNDSTLTVRDWFGVLELDDPSVTGTLRQVDLIDPRTREPFTGEGLPLVDSWYRGTNGRWSQFITNMEGEPVATLTRNDLSGDLSFAVDLNADGSIDVLNLVTLDFREAVIVNQRGLEFWRNWLRGINDFCLPKAQGGPQGGLLGRGANEHAMSSGCGLLTDGFYSGMPHPGAAPRSGQETLATLVDLLCGDIGKFPRGQLKLPVHTDPPSQSPREICKQGCAYQRQICMARCAADMVRMVHGGSPPLNILEHGAICALTCNATNAVCERQCEKTNPPKLVKEVDGSKYQRRDTDGDGDEEVECTNCTPPSGPATQSDIVDPNDETAIRAYCERVKNPPPTPAERAEREMENRCKNTPGPAGERGGLPPGFCGEVSPIDWTDIVGFGAARLCLDTPVYVSAAEPGGGTRNFCPIAYGDLIGAIGRVGDAIGTDLCDPIVCDPTFIRLSGQQTTVQRFETGMLTTQKAKR